jgi:hypothetical protein
VMVEQFAELVCARAREKLGFSYTNGWASPFEIAEVAGELLEELLPDLVDRINELLERAK